MYNMGSKWLSLRSQLWFIPINGNFPLRISKLHVTNNRSGAIMCTGGGTNSQDSSWACSSVQLSVPQPNPCFIKRPYPVIRLIYIPTPISSLCNLDFILCKHMTHMHWLVAFLKLGVRANSVICGMNSRDNLKNWDPLVIPNFYFNIILISSLMSTFFSYWF